ncbi:MAG: TolC family outer membrane protein [Alphaproteobacteria bacterium]
MLKLLQTGTALLAIGICGVAQADTLDEALAKAYLGSPRLQARQALLRSIDEQVAQAHAGWRPTLNGSATAERAFQTPLSGGSGVTHPRNLGLQLSQPLLRLQTYPEVVAAKRAVDSARADLVSQEQQLLFDTVSAYVNVLRDLAVLDLQKNNEQVLQKQLDATRDRFRVGEITRTDVSQSESRLAAATAERILAEGVLESSRANYVRVIGDAPKEVKKPEINLALPKTLDEAVAFAEGANPDVMAAKSAFEQSDQQVDSTLAALLPRIDLIGSAARGYDQSAALPQKTDTYAIGVRATIPLYQGGADYARTRQAKQTRSQRQLELEETRRRAHEAAVRAWQQYQSALAAIESRKSAVESNKIALKGTQQEAKVGTRTTLDVLNAEQEFLTAQVNLVRAEHDAVVAAYQIMAATGKLTAAELKLPVTLYDPQKHYDSVAGKWIGVGGR